MSLDEYYAQELSRLRLAARAFAEQNPAEAGHLFERGTDPDVERLLEGVAFLIAGFRSRIDQTTNVLAQHIAELSAPHLLRSLPAATIVEFSARTNALTQRHRIEQGKTLKSVSVDGTRCVFQTTSHTDLWPAEVEDASLEHFDARHSRISIALSLGKHGARALSEEAPLRFFIHHHSDPTLAPNLILWLSKHLVRISVEPELGDEIELPLAAIQLLSPTEFGVFPWPKSSPVGYRVAVEYFAFPEKFFFFELSGLDKLHVAHPRLTIHLEFAEAPRLATDIDRETFRLHCVPAVNLFHAHGEPIRRDPASSEFLLRAEDVDPRHMEVYDVISVMSYSRQRQECEYAPISGGERRREQGRRRYALRRERTVTNEGMDTFISLVEPFSPEDLTAQESLSIELLCTNRGLASKLRTGHIRGSSQQALYREYRNIARVSSAITPSVYREGFWPLASYMALGEHPPRDAASLRKTLRYFDLAGHEDGHSRLSRRQIDALSSLRVQPEAWVMNGVPMQMLLILAEVDDLAIGGAGAAHLLGHVLNALYCSFAPLNTAMRFRMKLTSTSTEYSWPVHLGT